MGPYKQVGKKDQTFSAVDAYKRLDRSFSATKEDFSKSATLKKSPDQTWERKRLEKSIPKFNLANGKYCCAYHRSTAMQTLASENQSQTMNTKYKTVAFDQSFVDFERSSDAVIEEEHECVRCSAIHQNDKYFSTSNSRQKMSQT